MEYIIREMKQSEYPVLEDFLYQAVFVPDGIKPPPKSIINDPALSVYIKDFGAFPGDKCLVAESNGEIYGAVWARIMNDYGHVDDATPSLAISLYRSCRRQGIGTALMTEMLKLLKECGYSQVSLSVQKANYAVKLYEKAGFEVFRDKGEEYIMICRL